MLPVIFFVQSKQQIFFSRLSLTLSVVNQGCPTRGGRRRRRWKLGIQLFLSFLPQTFFFFSPPPVSCGLMGEKVDELQRCSQGHRLRRDVQVQEATAFVRRLLCRFLAQMTGIHIWRSEFSISHFRPQQLCLFVYCVSSVTQYKSCHSYT